MVATAQKLVTVFGMTVAVMLIAYTLMGASEGFAFLGIGLGAWLIMGAVKDVYERLQVGRLEISKSWARAKGLPRSAYGTALAHAGLGLLVIGIASAGSLREDKVEILAPGDALAIAGYEVRLEETGSYEGPNFWSEYGDFTIVAHGDAIRTVRAERRIYPAEGQGTTEVGLHSSLWGDLYVVLGEAQDDGSGWAVTAAIHPLVRWIWAGAFLLCLGGMLSLSDMRFRIGAPRRAKSVSEPSIAAANKA